MLEASHGVEPWHRISILICVFFNQVFVEVVFPDPNLSKKQDLLHLMSFLFSAFSGFLRIQSIVAKQDFSIWASISWILYWASACLGVMPIMSRIRF